MATQPLSSMMVKLENVCDVLCGGVSVALVVKFGITEVEHLIITAGETDVILLDFHCTYLPLQEFNSQYSN